MLRLLDRLIDHLLKRRRLVSFEVPSPEYLGRYVHWEDTAFLPRFSDEYGKRKAASTLVHEYMHMMQDRVMERELLRTHRPQEHSKEDDLQQEIGAWRPGSYFVELAKLAGLDLGPSSAWHQGTMKVNVQHFEKIRTGSPQQAADEQRTVEKTFRIEYEDQFRSETPGRTYSVEISPANHAVLHLGAGGPGTVDLGAIPYVRTDLDLKREVRSMVERWQERPSLSIGPGGVPLQRVVISVSYQGRMLTQFLLEPPTNDRSAR